MNVAPVPFPLVAKVFDPAADTPWVNIWGDTTADDGAAVPCAALTNPEVIAVIFGIPDPNAPAVIVNWSPAAYPVPCVVICKVDIFALCVEAISRPVTTVATAPVPEPPPSDTFVNVLLTAKSTGFVPDWLNL